MSVSQRISNLIRSDKIWQSMLVDPNSRTVDFSHENTQTNCYPSNLLFEAEMVGKMPKETQMYILFPSHTNPKERVLDGCQYGDLTKLNREINCRMSRNPDHIQLAVCRGDYIYKVNASPRNQYDSGKKTSFSKPIRFRKKDFFPCLTQNWFHMFFFLIYKVTGATGNIYIKWSNELSLYREDDQQVDKMGSATGFIINTDGHWTQRSVYPLLPVRNGQVNDTLFICPSSFVFTQPTNVELYPCDVRKPPGAQREVVTLTEYDVRVHRERKVIPDHEQIQFPKEREDDGYPTTGRTVYDEGEEEEDDDDDVMAFFSAPVPGEQGAMEKQIRADINGSRNTVSSSEDEMHHDAPYYEPTAGILRHLARVPRSVVPRSEHRTSHVRVKYSPRRVVTSHSCEEESSSETNSPLSTPHVRPEGVSVLKLK